MEKTLYGAGQKKPIYSGKKKMNKMSQMKSMEGMAKKGTMMKKEMKHK